jgi:hypothetical protein
MYDNLSRFAQSGGQQVRVCVTGDEHQLKKQEAGCPDSGASAEPGQNVLANKRLNKEYQKRA